MKIKTLVLFCASVAVCGVAATHKFYDSAHAMGMLGKNGGTVRHPVLLEGGRDSYTIVASAGVLPPYRGDVRVVLEGEPRPDYVISSARPAVRLGLHRAPEFHDNVLHDVRPKDKVALWVALKPQGCREEKSGGELALAFYDTRSNDRLLRMPIRFIGKGGEGHAGEHERH